MADTQTTVTTLDIQMLNADRADATTIKLDNPVNNITREMVSSAMQTAFSNGWFLTTKGYPAMYLGDVTINQSIKTKLGGNDFYVTPTSLDYDITLEETEEKTITVSGAIIQGVNITDYVDENESLEFLAPIIAENGLSVKIPVRGVSTSSQATFKVKLVILGTEVVIPCTAQVS